MQKMQKQKMSHWVGGEETDHDSRRWKVKGQAMCAGSGVTSSSKLSGMKDKMVFMAADKEEEDTGEGSVSIRQDWSLSRLPAVMPLPPLPALSIISCLALRDRSCLLILIIY